MESSFRKVFAWLKNSATENLDGILKTGADIAIDLGQGVALSPLLLGGAKTYIAGVAANAAEVGRVWCSAL